MIEVLKQSRSIQTISLSVPPNFFIRYPHVKDAFICNETLVDLTLSNAAIQLLPILKNMRSNLRVLSLESMRMEDRPRDFSWFPSHCALQEFSISYPTSWPQWPTDEGRQFLSVRSLYVNGPLPLWCLKNVFPNIRSLTLNQCWTWESAGHPTVNWSQLDYLSFTVPESLSCEWEVRCPVRHMSLTNVVGLRFSDIIKNTKGAHPFILSIQLRGPTVPEDWDALRGIVQHVQLLELTLVYEECPNVIFWLVSMSFLSE